MYCAHALTMHVLYTVVCILHCALGSLTMHCTHCTDRGLRMAACNQLCGLGSLIDWLLHLINLATSSTRLELERVLLQKKKKQKKNSNYNSMSLQGYIYDSVSGPYTPNLTCFYIALIISAQSLGMRL